MIDDSDRLPSNQSHCLLKLHEGLNNESLVGQSKNAFHIRNNLVRALGLILKSLHECETHSHIAFTSVLQSLQHKASLDDDALDEIYQLGMEAMMKFNPDFNLE